MDKVVGVANLRDYVIVFTERGLVWKVVHDSLTETIKYERLPDFPAVP